MDSDGYPEDDELARLREWPLDDPEGWLDYAGELWHYPAPYWHKQGRVYYISTGGWSGNEDVLQAMVSNPLWSLCFVAQLRGGHYVLEPYPQEYDRVPDLQERWWKALGRE